MKKVLAILISAVLLVSMTSCSIEPIVQNGSSSNTEATEKTKKMVDENLLTVDVTLPASLFSEDDPATDVLTDEQKSQGFISAKLNSDGSVTYKIKKGDWKKLVDEMGKSIDESLEEMVTSGDTPSIKKITHNKDYTKFTVEVDRESFENSFDGMAMFGLYITVEYYLMFAQKGENFTIEMKDSATGKVYDTRNMPEDLEN